MSLAIELNIVKLRQRIAAAEKKYQRQPGSVQLMAVSKTRSAAIVRAAAAAGLTDMGENYLKKRWINSSNWLILSQLGTLLALFNRIRPDLSLSILIGFIVSIGLKSLNA